jgi:acyl-homoserine-lactone acylase
MGYAQMENHAELILQDMALARGRAAEYFGPGANNQNVTRDEQVITLRHSQAI